MKTISLVSILVLLMTGLKGQSDEENVWVDSVLQTMTLDEKIGQVFSIRAYSREDKEHIRSIKDQIKKYHIGGICFFQGDPVRQARLVNTYQDLSRIPLMISIDAEWGLGMRFPDKAISFPRQLTLGAITDHQLIYLMGKEIGRQCRLAGVTVNFAPVVDINNNPNNPVINVRSFGEDRYNVAAKSYAYMKGLSDARVLPCAKHFPGHGDTDVDSHYDLPVITHDRQRLDSIELFPFEMMIKQNIPAVMVTHLQVPALDDRPNNPTVVSEKAVKGVLRDEFGFQGLIFTDAMDMKGVTKYFKPGEADVAAFLAGNDVILIPENVNAAIKAFKNAVAKKIISTDRLEASVRRILKAKYDLGLAENQGRATPEGLTDEVNHPRAHVIKAKIYERAITLVQNNQNALPVRELSGTKFGSISLGSASKTHFQTRLDSYIDVDHFTLRKEANKSEYERQLKNLEYHDLVFISVHNMSRQASRNFGLTQNQIEFIHQLAGKTKVILSLFGSPYSLKHFDLIPTVLVGYEEDAMAQDAMAQALMGATDITGKLPVTANKRFRVGMGINIPSLNRIGFALPEAVGLHSDTLKNIEILVNEMIAEKAAPGCQVLIAKDNKIVYHKAFGYHTYDQKTEVRITDLYDVASVTKVMASTLCAMHLQDQGLFNLNDPVAKYVPEEDTTNKAGIIYEDMLAHVSGLAGWIPFYASTMDKELKKTPSAEYYRSSPEEGFEVMVTPKLYLRSDYPDTIWRKVFSSKLRSNNNYRYSDLAFFILNRTIQNLTGHQVDAYAAMNFYHPLGLRRTLFNPYKHFDRSEITPSEHDDYWRNEIVQGTVHDMGAAMLNGIGGHAGLFSNSLELGILMQMLLNGGSYGGRQYLRPNTIKYYTHRHWRSSRRGIGFDMKELDPDKHLNMSEKASRHTFGHTGFTGTAVFADPDYDLVYIFLSNRTFPTMNNNKLGKGNYRPKIQSIIYDALILE